MPKLTLAVLLIFACVCQPVNAMPDHPFGPVSGATPAPAPERDGERWRLTLERDGVGRVGLALPTGAEAYVVPAFAGVYVGTDDSELMSWLRGKSPLGFTDQLTVPFVALRYGGSHWVYALPDPYYAELEVAESGGLSIVFEVTPNRLGAEFVVEAWRIDGSPIDAARSVRSWLQERGAWRSLKDKVAANPKAARLLGAQHFYVFGDGVFSAHDVPREEWAALGRAIRDAKPGTTLGKIRARLNAEGKQNLKELIESEWPSNYAKGVIARQLAVALRDPALTGQSGKTPLPLVVEANRAALVVEVGHLLAPPGSWGDGISVAMLDRFRDAGIDRAVLTTSDLNNARYSPRVAEVADERGLLFGPYDSYGSIHPPDAEPDDTWETAQFDDPQLYETGKIVKADGEPFHGFKRVGYRLSPLAAWPAVQKRVEGRLADVGYSSWFIDVDSFGEFFDDYHPDHSATKPDDAAARRKRMAWLSDAKGLVVGSEGASSVMTGPLHFAHGVQLPHYGWGDGRLNQRGGEYDMGGHWPPEQPANFFKPSKVAPEYRRPLFTPTDRLPLFAAVFGDSVVATHHWQSGSLKYPDEAANTALLELLYNVPPLYHINRGAWEERGPIIARRFVFQSPLHRRLATAPLTAFDWFSDDRLLQRTTYTTDDGEVHLIANFADKDRGGYPAKSLTVEGAIELKNKVFKP